ncbi:hypothetical protein QC761_0043980 [Podospora bellae-mahoneyi]|uniref:Uncharacterized protein n=1 Tax=Podospora bellae-mahoneyi TaxID=2093777 RepID=A0ABR0FUB8_9PEZI|nr:hypothetical protein QC761_0043980 [Podospora bellae-mahoneyi]
MKRRRHAVKLQPLWQCLSPAASTPPICELVIVDNQGGASPDCQEVERYILLSSLHLDSVGQPRSPKAGVASIPSLKYQHEVRY